MNITKKIIDEIYVYDNLSLDSYLLMNTNEKKEFIKENIEFFYSLFNHFIDNLNDEKQFLSPIETLCLDIKYKQLLPLKEEMEKKLKEKKKEYKISFVDKYFSKIDDNFISDFNEKKIRSQYLKSYLIENNPLIRLDQSLDFSKAHDFINHQSHIENFQYHPQEFKIFFKSLNDYVSKNIQNILNEKDDFFTPLKLLHKREIFYEKINDDEDAQLYIEFEKNLKFFFPKLKPYSDTLHKSMTSSMTHYQYECLGMDFFSNKNLSEAISNSNDTYLNLFLENCPHIGMTFEYKQVLIVRNHQSKKVQMIFDHDFNQDEMTLLSNENPTEYFNLNKSSTNGEKVNYDFVENIIKISSYEKPYSLNFEQSKSWLKIIDPYCFCSYMMMNVLNDILIENKKLEFSLNEQNAMLYFQAFKLLNISDDLKMYFINKIFEENHVKECQQLNSIEKEMLCIEFAIDVSGLSLSYDNEEKSIHKKSLKALFENALMNKHLNLDETNQKKNVKKL